MLEPPSYRTISLVVLSAVVVFLCWRLTAPFLTAFTWAFALAVACAPLRRWLVARMSAVPAALLIVVAVLLVIGLPGALISHQLFDESVKARHLLQRAFQGGAWRNGPFFSGPWWNWANQQFDLSQIAQQVAAWFARLLAPAVLYSAGALSQLGIVLLALFFFVKDQEAILAAIRRFNPLTRAEGDLLILRVASAVEATVYGRLLIGSIQGFLGGVIFAVVGLPAAIFWGAVMIVLSTLPVLGSFLVWVPAGIYLFGDGHWGRALVVFVWGFVVIHPVDNLLYPVLVGSRLGLHPLALFVAFVGGLIVFGPAGLILGPCIIASATGLAVIWERST